MAFSRGVTHTKTLLSPSTGAEDKVYGADYVAADSHAPAVAGADVGGIPYCPTATTETTSANLTFDGTTLTATVLAGSGLTSGRVALVGASGVITDDAGLTYNTSTDNLTVANAILLPQGDGKGVVFNNGGNPTVLQQDFNGDLSVKCAGTRQFYVDGFGARVRAAGFLGFSNNTEAYNTADSSIGRAGTSNSTIFSAVVSAGGGGGGLVTSRAEINKAVTGIANNVATATFTVTIPNGAHSASGRVALKGAAGVGGAIGADEFSALVEYDWVVTRTTGVNAVVTLSAALLTAITASVAGGATPTIAGAVSAISGAVGATNTFTINVTINALTGSSTNHTCFAYCSLLNDNGSGVTIA